MSAPMSDPRHLRAGEELSRLAGELASREVLSVQCAHGHHVAAVFRTPTGLVFRSITGPHAHGRADLPDVAHHGHDHGTVYVEALDDPHADATLPGWCACGDWSMARQDLLDDVRSGTRTTHLA